MACFHPMTIRYDDYYGFLWTPIPFSREQLKKGYFPAPCGHCIGCDMDYANRWRDRMVLESLNHKNTWFVTLTYNDDNIVVSNSNIPTLVKQDAQQWQKRVRDHQLRKTQCDILKYTDEETGEEKTKYKTARFWTVGEYGTARKRPHYHSIVFGLNLPEGDLEFCGTSHAGYPLYRSKFFEGTWDKGYVTVSRADKGTIGYCARYTAKKQLQYNWTKNTDVVPPFSMQSNKPGIGAQFYFDNPECVNYEHITVSAFGESYKMAIPKYFRELEIKDLPEDEQIKIKLERTKKANEQLKAKMSLTTLSYAEFMNNWEYKLIEACKRLDRSDTEI